MERRVTPIDAPGRAESGRGSQRLGPDSGSASGRTAVTKADEGVAPIIRGAAQIVTPNNGSGSNGSGGVGIAEVIHELVRGQLSDYLDDALAESDRRRVEGHLAACPPCTAYLNTLRATVRALGVLPAPKAPSGIRARIIEQARHQFESSESSVADD
jgi:hypothetical protein